jgi:hypothetical protein
MTAFWIQALVFALISYGVHRFTDGDLAFWPILGSMILIRVVFALIAAGAKFIEWHYRLKPKVVSLFVVFLRSERMPDFEWGWGEEFDQYLASIDRGYGPCRVPVERTCAAAAHGAAYMLIAAGVCPTVSAKWLRQAFEEASILHSKEVPQPHTLSPELERDYRAWLGTL